MGTWSLGVYLSSQQLKSLNTLQPRDPVQTPQPAGPPITMVLASPTQQPRRFHLSHALIAAGVVAASGFGSAVLVKNVFILQLKAWIKKVVAKEKESEGSLSIKLAEEAAETEKAATASAAIVAKRESTLRLSREHYMFKLRK